MLLVKALFSTCPLFRYKFGKEFLLAVNNENGINTENCPMGGEK
jgi:hypothetical protein